MNTTRQIIGTKESLHLKEYPHQRTITAPTINNFTLQGYVEEEGEELK